jgi:hexosaminidase
MTPGKYCYFDHAQIKDEDSLTIGGYLPLDTVYSYEPVPRELNLSESKYVLGAQGNVWTEYIGNNSKLEYMIFPRMTALSEVLWSPKENSSIDDFKQRLTQMNKRYELWNANYFKEK